MIEEDEEDMGDSILVVLATGIALSSLPLNHAYPTVLDVNEVDDGPGWCAKALESPSDTWFRGYLTGVMENYRGGQPDCQGGTGDWENALCLQNTIIRWSGESQFAPAFENDLGQCYWHWCELLTIEYCYPDWNNGSQNDPVYYAFIGNDDRKFYHAVCAEHEGGNTSDFDNWRFFQYRDNDIEPRDWQMPCGTSTDDTYVSVQRTDDVWCNGIDATTVYSWNIDKGCNVSSREVRSAYVTDEDAALMKSRIEELQEVPEMRIGATAIHRAEKMVVLWIYERTPENERLHGEMIDGWEIIVAESAKPSEDTEVTVDMIRDVIEELRKVPEMQIGGISTDSALKTVTLWVDERTPENERLHHEMIDGWEIIVAKSYEPSISDTFYDIFTNTPILWILAGCVFISLVIVFVKYRGRRKG